MSIKTICSSVFHFGSSKSNRSTGILNKRQVRYADNNEIVTSGVVKMFDSNGNLVGSASISYSGDYILWAHRVVTGQTNDLIGFPNIEPEEDYVPTCLSR